MALQSTIRIDQASGVIGDEIFSGPRRAEPGVLNTSSAANNVIGRAFTRVSGSDISVAAGGTGVFGGILVNSKEYATSGPSTGALDATLALPNGTPVSLLISGYIVVSLAGAANVGDDVHFVQATGALLAASPGATPSAGNSAIPNAQVAYFNTTGAGLAVIRLNN